MEVQVLSTAPNKTKQLDEIGPPTLPQPSGETPASQTAYSSSVVPNQILPCGSNPFAGCWTYDKDGNVTAVGGIARTFTYDGENRQVTATIGAATSNYSYDGQGLRVGKTANGNSTTYVYDAWGNLDAEYSNQAQPSPCGTSTCYPVVDNLGSLRMLTDANGSTTVERYDYLPYGTEILAPVDSRATTMGYATTTPDGANPKFTGQYRDSETAAPTTNSALDWFNVRYLSDAQGRFQSVDPGNAGADPTNPQTWNMYAYVANNPMSFTDPSGESFWSVFAGIFSGLGTFLATGDPLAGAEVGLGVDNTIDSAENGQFPLTGLLELAGGGAAVAGDLLSAGSGGPVNTGGVWGSGNTGPFINNIIEVQAGGTPTDYENYFSALKYLSRDPAMALIIRHLRTSSTVYHVKFVRDGDDAYNLFSKTVSWDPTSSLVPTSGGCQSAALGLGHELAHADSSRILSFIRGVTPAGAYDSREEQRVIMGPEASAARTLGESIRYDHSGRLTRAPNSTSRVCR